MEFHDFRDATRDPLPAFILVVDSLHAGKKAHNFILVYPVLAYDMSYAKCNLSFLLTFLCRRLTQADKQLRALGHIDLTTLTSQLEKRHLSKVGNGSTSAPGLLRTFGQEPYTYTNLTK